MNQPMAAKGYGKVKVFLASLTGIWFWKNVLKLIRSHAASWQLIHKKIMTKFID